MQRESGPRCAWREKKALECEWEVVGGRATGCLLQHRRIVHHKKRNSLKGVEKVEWV